MRKFNEEIWRFAPPPILFPPRLYQGKWFKTRDIAWGAVGS